MKTVQVPLGNRSYSIIIGHGVLAQLKLFLHQKFPGVTPIILTNPRVYRLHGHYVERTLGSSRVHWLIIPDGEKFKNLATVASLYNKLLKLGATRQSVLIAFGGGVIGDIGGFVAATFLRGIPYLQLPTTLLAQVDSSVGGKTGIDLDQGKNLVGAFYQPRFVLIDTTFLQTLPLRQLRCGLSEVVKYGCINSPTLFKYLETHPGPLLTKQPDALAKIIAQSVSIKANVVSRDEQEAGLRAILNFGHTLGHAIESLGGYQKVLHGEAVSMGMVYSTLYSHKLRLCTEITLNRLVALLKELGLPTKWPRHSPQNYLKKVLNDKKRTPSALNFIAIKKIGEVKIIPVSPKHLLGYL